MRSSVSKAVSASTSVSRPTVVGWMGTWPYTMRTGYAVAEASCCETQVRCAPESGATMVASSEMKKTPRNSKL